MLVSSSVNMQAVEYSLVSPDGNTRKEILFHHFITAGYK